MGMAEESMKTDKNIKGGRNRTVTMEENDEALRLAMEQYAKLTIPWQKEKLITQTKKTLEKNKNRDWQRFRNKLKNQMKSIIILKKNKRLWLKSWQIQTMSQKRMNWQIMLLL